MRDEIELGMGHPILRNHKVYGKSILPGVSYIDLIYQFFVERGYDYKRLELANLAIHLPLVVEESSDVLLDISAQQLDDKWKIEIQSFSKEAKNDENQKQTYVTAEMKLVAPIHFDEEVNIENLPIEHKANLEDIYKECRSQELLHTGFMKADGKVYEFNEACWIDISIPQEALFSSEEVCFHPTLLDGAAIGSAMMFAEIISNETRLFLPLYYESFRANSLLNNNCFVRIKKSSVSSKKELLSLTMEFFNRKGLKIAELTNCTNKLVRTKGLINASGNIESKREKIKPIIENENTVDSLKEISGSRNTLRFQEYLKGLIGQKIKTSPSKVNVNKGYYELGLSSPDLLDVVSEIEGKMGKPVSPILLFEHTTIAELAEYMAQNSVDNTESIHIESDVTSNSVKNSDDNYSFNSTKDESDIAIINVEGKYPKAKNVDEFWENLLLGKDCVSKIPDNRWSHSPYFDEIAKSTGKPYCKWGGFINGVKKFDPLFFNLSPNEAELMDPQVRLLLQTIWHLLEGVGYTRKELKEKYKSKVGLFVGSMYQQYQAIKSDPIKDSIVSLHSYSYIANRVSYFYDFQGPSIAIDTMCSSSLIAVHMACESIRNKECDIAIAGGVNLSIHPNKYLGLSLIQMLASNLNSRSFAVSDGFIPAEGVGAVLLKSLKQAKIDGDQILAVIKSSHINHSGNTNGYSVPSVKSQVQLIEENFKKAKIDPRSISYVEAAANGSALGDPIEVVALQKSFRKFTDDSAFCALGSVKSTIGHAEAASGISQLTKLILQLKNKKITPTIKSKPLNPNIKFENTPFYLADQLLDWDRPIATIEGKQVTLPRRGTVSSYGAGGSNCHMILEEYEANYIKEKGVNHFDEQLFIFSANSEYSLIKLLRNTKKLLQSNRALNLSDMAFTLQTGREVMDYRVAILAENRSQLYSSLKRCLKYKNLIKAEKNDLRFMFGSIEYRSDNLDELKNGESTDSFLDSIIERGDLNRIGNYWVNGADLTFHKLWTNRNPQIVKLVRYPFEKRKCWMNEDDLKVSPNKVLKKKNIDSDNRKSAKKITTHLIAEIMGLDSKELVLTKPLVKYGLDSITFVRLAQDFQRNVSPNIDLVSLSECETINDIIGLVAKNQHHNNASNGHDKILETPSLSQFPELIKLNNSNKGKPVFWLHAVMGSVESYFPIAQSCDRPFYGIQARGWMTDRQPLNGIQAMVAYYIQIIQSVQPEGPYDLGGYSLGGLLSYEITRQLQELGQKVNSIVMLDSIYTTDVKMEDQNDSHKAAILQAVNMMLFSNIIQEPEKIEKTLIHRNEVDTELDDESFWYSVVELAKERGLTMSTDQLHTLITQNSKIQESYQFDNYKIIPLIDPSSPKCYFFKNKSGTFYGKLSPYFNLSTTSEKVFDNIDYWTEWKRNIRDFRMFDVPSSNHMMFLSEPKVYKRIIKLTKELYSQKTRNKRKFKKIKKEQFQLA